MYGHWIEFVLVCIIAGVKLEIFSIKKEYLDTQMLGFIFKSYNEESHHRCVRTCKAVSRCKSTNFHRRRQTCELNFASSSEVDITYLVPRPGSAFSDNSDWPTAGDRCEGSPCQTGTCFPAGQNYVCKTLGNCNYIRIADGTMNDTSTEIGTYLKITCTAGYELKGSDVIECLSDGYWSDYPECYKIQESDEC